MELINLNTEERIIEQSESTALSFEVIEKLVEIPKDVKGKKILIIGAEASDLTAVLLGRGADAYAIDPRYKDINSLTNYVDKHIAKMNGIFSDINRALEYERKQKQTLSRFLESARLNPEHYIAAKASQLPFRDNTFDMVFSINCVLGTLDLEKNLLFKAKDEAIRVTKPEGVIQFFPIYGPQVLPIKNFDVRKRNQKKLDHELSGDSSISYDIFSPMEKRDGWDMSDESDVKTLVIIKNAA